MPRLSRSERKVWHYIQKHLEKRAGARIKLPEWFDQVADLVFVDDVRVRRYWPAFIAACHSVCLLRSFQKARGEELEIDFADFAITALIFSSVFTESIHRKDDSSLETRYQVEKISMEADGSPVRAKDLAKSLGISRDCAYSRLRIAQEYGLVSRVNKPEKGNIKLYLPTPLPVFIPDPREIFDRIREIPSPIKFMHPITGQLLKYTRR
jgi:hypothetical protein